MRLTFTKDRKERTYNLWCGKCRYNLYEDLKLQRKLLTTYKTVILSGISAGTEDRFRLKHSAVYKASLNPLNHEQEHGPQLCSLRLVGTENCPRSAMLRTARKIASNFHNAAMVEPHYQKALWFSHHKVYCHLISIYVGHIS